MLRRLAIFAAFALVAAAVCVRLGIWQLSRLAQRRRANAAVAARLDAPAVPLESLPASPEAARWRRVRVDGAFDYAREALLANRTHNGSPGAYLLTPLRRAGVDTAVFVNRGWVYAGDGRTVDLARWREDSTAHGEGYVELFPEAQGNTIGDAPGDTVVLRRLERDRLARRAGAPVAPYYVVLLADSAAPAAGGAGSRSVAERPGRLGTPALDEGPHLSYAIQWFSFAAIAVGGVVGMWITERRRQEAASRSQGAGRRRV